MTDLAPPDHALKPCPNCGAQNDESAARCDRCGAVLRRAEASAAALDEVELDEAWRAAAAGGFDVEMELIDGEIRCPVCATRFGLVDATDVVSRPVRDTLRPDADLVVVTLRCPVCRSAGRVEADADDVAPLLESAEAAVRSRDADEVEPIHERVPGSTEEHPLGSDRRFFAPARPGSLRDQGPLLDEQGEDIRQYTGEPVETLDGWVLPQQQNMGPGNEAGGGEFPDPTTPPAQGRDDEAGSHSAAQTE